MSAYRPILAPNEKPLALTLFKGNEGIMTKGVRVFEGILLAHELAEFFEIEPSSELYPEYLKRQRDLEKVRADKLVQYFTDRKDTMLPSLIVFISHLTNEQGTVIGNREMVVAQLDSTADRLVGDGQNRCQLYKTILKTQPWRATETVNVKFICVDDTSLENYGTIMRQVFSDLHYHVKKPTTSLNLYFDSSQPYRRLLDRLLEIETHGTTVASFISTGGKAKEHNILLLSQLLDFVGIAIGKTATAINKLLKSTPELEDQLFTRYAPVVQSYFNLCPLQHLSELNKDDTMFAKYIFAKAVAWAARSIVEESVEEEVMRAADENRDFNANAVQIDFSKLAPIANMPLQDMKDPVWIKAGAVVKMEDEEKGTTAWKMVRGSEKVLARTLCRRCKIQPSQAI